MQLFSWMTWIVSLILAVGALLNISHTLDAQTLPLTWQQKYIIVITAAWPLYIAFALALLAGVGATLEILADAPTRSTGSSPIPAPDKAASKKPSRSTRQTEDSYLSHLAHHQSSGTDFEPIHSTPSRNEKLSHESQAESLAQDTAALTHVVMSQDTAALAHVVIPHNNKEEKASDLEFFRM